MKRTVMLFFVILFICLLVSPASNAQVKPVKIADQKSLLKSSDPKLAKNKKLVYDFWREVFEAGHIELAQKYMTETYIQHNPVVPTGRKGFTDFFGQFVKPQPIVDTIKADLFAITAEGDLVSLFFTRIYPEPRDSSKTYHTTWFDMFRIENGKIAEHWDAATKK